MTPDTPETATPTMRMLLDLPRSERRDALEELVTEEFKAVLLMTDEDDLPPDQSYFDLGMTSLSITGLKQRFERLLGIEVDANLLFNSPTVEALLRHLTEDLLTDLFHAPAAATAAPSATTPNAFLDAALKNLYQR
ncbi:acyl carrier protein [Streptomyces sp. NPDC088116]|uniref:acyl carrier protein n=1 Tax=Streptomyces sp. NPDC088116 TaxID=3365825 RepID=UPI00382B5810